MGNQEHMQSSMCMKMTPCSEEYTAETSAGRMLLILMAFAFSADTGIGAERGYVCSKRGKCYCCWYFIALGYGPSLRGECDTGQPGLSPLCALCAGQGSVGCTGCSMASAV